jgi:hypothetical protein
MALYQNLLLRILRLNRNIKNFTSLHVTKEDLLQQQLSQEFGQREFCNNHMLVGKGGHASGNEI